MGPITSLSHPKGYRYISVFVYDYSRLALAYAMGLKSDTGHCFEMFVRITRNLLGRDAKVCYLRSDQDTEFTGGYTGQVLERSGSKLQLACPDTPEHNGTAERFNEAIRKKFRTYINDEELPKNLWHLALNAAVYAYNRTQPKSNSRITPLEKFAPQRSFDINQIKRFGCVAYIKVEKKLVLN